MEKWKELKGFSKYKISNTGKILSKYKGKLLKQQIWGNHYKTVALLSDKNKRKCFKVHRLVCLCFLENPKNYKVINHKDGNKFNNNLENLEWCTNYENIQHAINTGLSKVKGEDNPNAKLTIENVKQIRKLKKEGVSFMKIMKQFNIGQTQVYRIVRKELWKTV